MIDFRGFFDIGHPGLAPFVWWVISVLAVIQLLYFAAGMWGYWRVRSQSREAKRRVLLPLASLMCFNMGLLFESAMLQLSRVSDVPLPVALLPMVLVMVCMTVWVIPA